ncbi:MAG: MCP four helix bundle domain-containing protein, partial [Fibrobacterota bacterium]
MTVKQRLALLVSIASLGLGLVAGTGIYQMERVYKSANFGNENSVPALLALDSAFRSMADMRVQVLKYMVVPDQNSRAELERQIGDNTRNIDVALKSYERTIADDKDRELLDRDRSTIAAYIVMRDRCMGIARSGNNAEGLVQLLAARQTASDVWDAFVRHSEYNAELGAAAAKDANVIKASAFKWAIG